MRDRKLVEQAQQLHTSGLRICDVAKIINIPTWNVSRWCRKSLPLNSISTSSTHQEIRRYNLYNLDKIRIRSISQTTAKIYVSLLYWCEGCKYPGTNKLEFVSSDEVMQQTFIRLLRKAYKDEIDESKFRVMLQLHTTHSVPDQIKYWSNILSIPESQFIKPHLTVKTASRYRTTYNGTCNLRYSDYRLLLRIMGIYHQVSSQIINQML